MPTPFRRITLRDVAKVAGCHFTTVSLALRNHPGLPIATAERLRTLATKMGYVPDPMLASLSSYRASLGAVGFHATLAWVTNHSTRNGWKRAKIFEDYFVGAMKRARSLGYRFEEFWLRERGMTPARSVQILQARGISGLVIAPQPEPSMSIDLDWSQLSAVAIGYSLAQPSLHVVCPNQYRAIRQAMNELQLRAYRRPGLVMLRASDDRVDSNWTAGFLTSQRSLPAADRLPPLLLDTWNDQKFGAWLKRYEPDNTLARPSYGDLVPYRVLADTQADTGSGGLDPTDYPETTKVFLGNADLKAQQSQNYDLSLEYYIQPAGLFSVAVFRKDLTDVIYRSQFKDPALPSTIYFQDRNGSSGKVSGVEISWQQALTFLPGPLDGLGINVNATFTKGSSVLQELVPGSTSTYRDFKVDFLPEQPETVYNVQLWWEKYGVTARVAVNFVDDFVRTSGGLTSFSVNNKATRMDASLSYRIHRNLTVYVEGKNLTEEVESWYATTPNRPEDYNFKGMTFNGGVKFRF